MAEETKVEAPASTIDLMDICEGVVPEAFALELSKCMHNISDLNTSPTAARVISMQFTLSPREDRIQVVVDFRCSSKLSTPSLSGASRLFIGADEDGGLVPLKSDPRQMNIWKAPKPKEVPAPIQFQTASK